MRKRTLFQMSQVSTVALVILQILSPLIFALTVNVPKALAEDSGVTDNSVQVTPTDIPEPTATAEVTPTPIDTLVPTDTPIPTDTPLTTIVPEPTASPVTPATVCSDGQGLVNTTASDWNVDTAKGTAETKAPIQLGYTYVFPLNNKVSITFNCLPGDVSARTSLKISQINIADLNLPEGTNAIGGYGYDITTGMVTGSFNYDMTLPKPAGETASVAYMETPGASLQSIDGTKLIQGNDNVEVQSADHFSIYIIISPTCVVDPHIALLEKAVNGDDADNAPGITVYAGDTVNFTYVVKNTGNVDLTNITVTDDKGVSVTCPKTSLSVNETMTCTGSAVAILGQYTNTAHANAKYSTTTITSNPDSANYFGITKMGQLIVHKMVDTNGDGTYEVTNDTVADNLGFRWGLNTTPSANTYLFTSAQTLIMGSYSVYENSIAGYHFAGWYLTPNNASMTCANTDNITLPALVSISASTLTEVTLCNVRDTGTIQVKKLVSPADSGATGWDFTISGPTANTALNIKDGGQSSVFTSVIGDYTITESAHAGTVLANYNPTFSCADSSGAIVSGTGAVTSSFKLQKDENIICTFTNSINRGSISVVKNMVGGTGFFSFTGNLSGTISVNNGYLKAENLVPGIYTSTESPTSSWNLTSITCNDATNGGTPSTDNVITRTATFHLDAGENIVCTFTNTKNATLIVKKHVINDDKGTLKAAAFNLNVTGTDVSPSTFAGSESGTTVTLKPGSYNVDETNLPGYANTLGANCSGTIAAGETRTCTITNDDIKPTLKVVKVVINNNGGTMQVSDFPLKVSWPSHHIGVISGDVNSFSAGNYTVGETQKSGYQATYSGDCDKDGKVTLTVGDVLKTCTITNDDIQPELIVKKFVNNDFGGTLHSGDFTLHTDNVASGLTISTFPGSTSGQVFNLNAGQYKVWEDPVTGYKLDYDNACNDKGVVTLKVGDVKVCELKNHDIKPELKVIKTVINDNGGTKDANDFWFLVHGSFAFPFLFWGDKDGTDVGLHAGSYNVEELLPTKEYTTTYSEDCTGTIAIGQVKTCMVTNDDVAPQLRIVKTVINDNGGTLGVKDFTFKVNGVDVSSSVTDNIALTYNVGTYHVSEDSVKGYQATVWGGDCASDGKVKLHLGDVKTCTITNNDIAPQLHLRKVVINDNGGTALVTDWTLTATGSTGTNLSGSSPVDSDNTFYIGTYTLGETGPAGYTASAWDCVGGSVGDNEASLGLTFNSIALVSGETVTLGLADNVTCTIVNDDNIPPLKIAKINNASVPLKVGDNTTFTITLRVPEGYEHSTLKGLKVTDLFSEGFQYVAGSFSATVDGMPVAIPEPTYHSPGVWDLTTNLGTGNPIQLTSDNTVVLKYQAKLVDPLDAGTYKDIAWAVAYAGTTPVLATDDANNDPNDYFVGTQVLVAQGTTPQSVKIVTQQLPRTGSDVSVVIASILMVVLGFSLILLSFGNRFAKRRTLKIVLSLIGIPVVLSIVAFAGAVKTFALPYLNLNVENIGLKAADVPTGWVMNKNEFDVTFVTMDLTNTASIDITCYYKGPMDAAYVKFPNMPITISAPGGSNVCKVTSDMTVHNGDYAFKVVAKSSNPTSDTKEVEVFVTKAQPQTPVAYSKVKNGCGYTINFTTANDGRTVKVELFRSQATSFMADSNTRVASVAILPAQSGVFNNTVPDCNANYYYVIRAVDSVENHSGYIGDTHVVIITPTATPAPTGTVTPGATGSVTGTPAPSGTEGNGQNNGGTPAVSPEVSGGVLGQAQTDNTPGGNVNFTYFILATTLGVLVLGGIVYVLSRRKV